MARMIPATMPAETESAAEKQLFPILRDGLDNSFTVFHSFDLLTRNLENKFIEGEIDFLIFSPERGFLVLEVKSGLIAFDGPTGTWYQNARRMDKSPFEQARVAKYQLLKFLTQKLGHVPPATFAEAVCFPDVSSEMRGLPSGIDPALCITAPALPAIGKTVSQIMDGFEKDGPGRLDKDEGDRISQILMPHCEYGAKLSEIVAHDERVLFALTETQCRCLDFIHNRKQALIEGCAGSGKTVMAIKKARELADGGATVLLLAYNNLLGEHLAVSLKTVPNVTASTYHDFCVKHLREAGRLPPDRGEKEYWEKVVPEAFAGWLKENPVRFDAVIVDEGQDFRLEYWVTIEEMLKPDGYFYIFYDPAQNIFKTEMELPFRELPFTLNETCRNTRKIFDQLKSRSRMDMRPMNGAPLGKEVVEFCSSTPRNSRKHLGTILHELHEQGVDRRNVAIIGAHSLVHTCLKTDPGIGNYIVKEDSVDGPNVVRYYTYMKFKGCEADAVILLDVDSKDERWADPALYTAMSRARHLLYVIHKE